MKSMRFVWPVQRKGSMEIQHSPRAVSAAKIAECVKCSAVLTRPAVAYSYALPPCQQVFVLLFVVSCVSALAVATGSAYYVRVRSRYVRAYLMTVSVRTSLDPEVVTAAFFVFGVECEEEVGLGQFISVACDAFFSNQRVSM